MESAQSTLPLLSEACQELGKAVGSEMSRPGSLGQLRSGWGDGDGPRQSSPEHPVLEWGDSQTLLEPEEGGLTRSGVRESFHPRVRKIDK